MDPNDPRYIPVGRELPAINAAPQPAAHKGTEAKGKPKASIGQRFTTLNDFVDHSLSGLTRVEIAVWLVLYRDSRDGSARTAMSDIARRVGCNRCSVVRAMTRLETLGLVKVIYRGGIGKGASRYKVKAMTGCMDAT